VLYLSRPTWSTPVRMAVISNSYVLQLYPTCINLQSHCCMQADLNMYTHVSPEE
jgi:hypothetical protein